MTASRIWQRLYADFLMPPRLAEYDRLLGTFLDHGYAVVSVERFWRIRQGFGVDPGRRYLVLRHDVDTDPGTARRMLAIEQTRGVLCSSYYFRLSTIDVALMRSISELGGEAGYHYEELSTLVKRHRLRTREEALARLPQARAAFRRNLEALRERTGLPIGVVAAHGDFANRALRVWNWEVLADPAFRSAVGVELEVYDDELMGQLDSEHADAAPPRCWVPEAPEAAIGRDAHAVFVLVHPRHWQPARLVNARDDLSRAFQAARFGLPPVIR